MIIPELHYYLSSNLADSYTEKIDIKDFCKSTISLYNNSDYCFVLVLYKHNKIFWKRRFDFY